MLNGIFRGLMPAAALLIALAWPAHVLAADHTAADLDCQVSVLASSSELNSDTADNLLERPAESRVTLTELPAQTPSVIVPPAFLCRAPPFF